MSPSSTLNLYSADGAAVSHDEQSLARGGADRLDLWDGNGVL